MTSTSSLESERITPASTTGDSERLWSSIHSGSPGAGRYMISLITRSVPRFHSTRSVSSDAIESPAQDVRTITGTVPSVPNQEASTATESPGAGGEGVPARITSEGDGVEEWSRSP